MTTPTPSNVPANQAGQVAARHYPSVSASVVGACHWEHDAEASYLVDEAGSIWQTHYRDSAPDAWARSLQRHETMGDAF